MDARLRFRVRGRGRRRGEAGGGILYSVLSFLSFCLCRRRSRRVHPDAVPVEEEGFLGGPAQLFGVDGGAGSTVGGKLIFLYMLFNFNTLYLEFSSLKLRD